MERYRFGFSASSIDIVVPADIDVGSYLSPDFAHHGIPVCSIPFEGGDTEEVYFRLFDLGFDGFSSDYPSVMFSVIHKLKAKA